LQWRKWPLNFDDLKTAWKCQDKTEFSKLNQDQLLERLKSEQRSYNRALFRGDVLAVGVMAAFIAFMPAAQSGMEIVWPLYLGATLILDTAVRQLWSEITRRQLASHTSSLPRSQSGDTPSNQSASTNNSEKSNLGMGLLTGPILKNLPTASTFNDGSAGETALGWSVRKRDSIGRILKKDGGRNNTSAGSGFGVWQPNRESQEKFPLTDTLDLPATRVSFSKNIPTLEAHDNHNSRFNAQATTGMCSANKTLSGGSTNSKSIKFPMEFSTIFPSARWSGQGRWWTAPE
jgi:hypothetical protein